MRNLLKNTNRKELIELGLAVLLVALGIIAAATTASRIILGLALVLAGMLVALQIFLQSTIPFWSKTGTGLSRHSLSDCKVLS